MCSKSAWYRRIGQKRLYGIISGISWLIEKLFPGEGRVRAMIFSWLIFEG
jgi:hypothetical protein